MIDFPKYQILLNGYAVNTVQQLRRTEFESGHVRQSRRLHRQVFERNITLLLCSAEQYCEFQKLVHDDLCAGALSFRWTCPERESCGKQNPIVARIKNGTYNAQPVGKNMDSWQVSFVLETWHDE